MKDVIFLLSEIAEAVENSRILEIPDQHLKDFSLVQSEKLLESFCEFAKNNGWELRWGKEDGGWIRIGRIVSKDDENKIGV